MAAIKGGVQLACIESKKFYTVNQLELIMSFKKVSTKVNKFVIHHSLQLMIVKTLFVLKDAC